MRTIVSTLALGALLAACGGEDATTAPPQTPAPPPPAPVATADMPAPPATAEPAPAPAPSLADKIQATLQGLGEAMKAHDADKVASFYAADAVVKGPGMPDKTGTEAIAGEWKQRFASFPDGKTAPRRVFSKDDVVIAEFTFVGTNTGPGPMGAKPTNKAVGVNGLAIHWFNAEGKIKEEHDYLDAATFMAQMGMGPKGMKAREPAALPTAAPEMHPAKGSPEEAANVEKAKAVDKAFESHDEKAFAEANADDIVWDDFTAPAPSNGKKEAVKMFLASTKAFPDMKMSCDAWGFDDYVVQECTMSGTNKGPLAMGPTKHAATNKPVTFHGVDVIQIKDGKAAKGWSYGNGMEFATQLGLVPTPKEPGAKTDAAKKPADKAAPAKADKGDVSKAPKK